MFYHWRNTTSLWLACAFSSTSTKDVRLSLRINTDDVITFSKIHHVALVNGYSFEILHASD